MNAGCLENWREKRKCPCEKCQSNHYMNFVYINVADNFLWAGQMQLGDICLNERKKNDTEENLTELRIK